MLREWEEMHRPPALGEPIRPSGPVRSWPVSGMVAKMSKHSNKFNENRRFSVVSSSFAGGITNFPLKSVRYGQDMRRPSDMWQGRDG